MIPLPVIDLFIQIMGIHAMTWLYANRSLRTQTLLSQNCNLLKKNWACNSVAVIFCYITYLFFKYFFAHNWVLFFSFQMFHIGHLGAWYSLLCGMGYDHCWMLNRKGGGSIISNNFNNFFCQEPSSLHIFLRVF